MFFVIIRYYVMNECNLTINRILYELELDKQLNLIDIGTNVGQHCLAAALIGRDSIAIDAAEANIEHVCASAHYLNFLWNCIFLKISVILFLHLIPNTIRIHVNRPIITSFTITKDVKRPSANIIKSIMKEFKFKPFLMHQKSESPLKLEMSDNWPQDVLWLPIKYLN
jgi:hypothetical protein